MKCQARILKEYKTTKADCMWPESVYGSNDVGNLPICGGDITVKVRAVDEPYFGGCSAKLELEVICTKCKHPWFPARIDLESQTHNYEGWNITSLLENIG